MFLSRYFTGLLLSFIMLSMFVLIPSVSCQIDDTMMNNVDTDSIDSDDYGITSVPSSGLGGVGGQLGGSISTCRFVDQFAGKLVTAQQCKQKCGCADGATCTPQTQKCAQCCNNRGSRVYNWCVPAC